MLDGVLWILLGINSIVLILLIALFFRALKGSTSLGKELREELRFERAEERQSSAELRQEISKSSSSLFHLGNLLRIEFIKLCQA